MTSCPRSDIFREGEVGVYHLFNRCVRQEFLLADDANAADGEGSRRNWIVRFEQELVRLFAVEVGFHAEMLNHLHVIVRVRPDIVATWSDEEVVRRWLTITHLVRSKDGHTIKPLKEQRIAKELADKTKVAKARRKLASISNFMGSLCEHISRRCNAQDGRKGTFWEDRFKCQELTDEASILCCGVYVDLNQIRAGEALTPEESLHTSAYERITAWRCMTAAIKAGHDAEEYADSWLCKLTLDSGCDASSSICTSAMHGRRASDKGLLPIGPEEYLQLLDVTGRMIRPGKAGAIPDDLPPILERLTEQGMYLNGAAWGDAVISFGKRFGHVVGCGATLAKRAAATGRKWLRGQSRCEEVFGLKNARVCPDGDYASS